MRNLLTNVQKGNPNWFSTESAYTTHRFQKLTLFILIFMASVFGNGLLAQDCLSCETSSLEDPIEIEISGPCEAVVRAADLESDASSCTQEKMLIIANLDGKVLYEGIDSVTVDSADLISETLVATIRSSEDPSVCQAFFRIVDTIAPEVICENLRLFCWADTCVTNTGYPLIMDNCGELDPDSITYEDVVMGEGCVGNLALVLHREWTVKDKSGNTASCTQVITLERPDLGELEWPANVKLDCPKGDVSPEELGYPTLDGQRLDQGGFCNVTVSYSDERISVCGNIGIHIKRSWNVKDECNNVIQSHLQNIRIVDEIAPAINSPKDIIIRTEPGMCLATVNIPVPEVTDNCDSNPVILVETSYGQKGFGPHLFVPKGLHMIHYTAMDRCGNQTKFSARLEIVDGQAPTAIADEYTSVAISTTGFAKVPAGTFDSGSYDNCEDQVFFKARKLEIGSCDGLNGDDDPLAPRYQEWFDDELRFCCDEVGQEVIILMRVYDVDPGKGPVDPKREGPGGDLEGHFTDARIVVEVQDNVPPLMTTLQNVTIDCEDDYSDLSQFGSPEVFDYCGYTLDSTVVYDLNECGLGTIKRIFTATDLYNNQVKVTQTIYVENESPFTEDKITWPENYTTNKCIGEVRPEDLPDPYSQPRFRDENCSDLSVTYEDHVYENQGEECYKIVRRWTVIDLCQHDPKDPSSEGRFEHLQIIKVDDQTAPELEIPNDTIVALTDNCGSVYVTLKDAVVMDCYAQATISNDSPYADGRSANASGTYPLGTTTVEFTAIDRCGNVTKKSTIITVMDQTAPQIRCRVGFEVVLSDVNGTISGTVQAPELDFGSIDNCSDPSTFRHFIRKSDGNPSDTRPTTTSVSFSCEDLGRQAVELWVSDENDNSGFCLTFIQVTDPGNLCTNTTTGTNSGGSETENATDKGIIVGSVMTEEGYTVEGVSITLKSDSPLKGMTGATGDFIFQDIPFGKNYVVIPEKNTEVMNGISTLDLVFMAKHITGTQGLDSPYKWVAADIDGNGSVSTLDLIRLRKLILHLDDQLPNNQTSWRFIDANFEFSDKQAPLNQQYPSKYDILNMNSDMIETDFIAVKVGDVNVSAQANSLMNIEPRSSANDLSLTVENQEVTAGEEFSVTFKAASQTDLLGYQFTLDFDPEKMELVDVQEGTLPNTTIDNFGLRFLDDGLITTSWNYMEGLILDQDTELFTLTFRAYEDVELKETIALTSRLTATEAYNESGEVYNVSLNFTGQRTEPTLSRGYQLYQNRPNPFGNQTQIGFELPTADEVNLVVYDASGKEIYHYNEYLNAGYHELTLHRSDLPATGLMYYKLMTKDFTATKKMIMVK
jgi:hypothetical protein